jgi:short-subunit dehydrogenase
VALSETLRSELAPAGVGVSVACPGFFRSGLLDRAKMCSDDQREFARKQTDEARRTADEVADDILTGVDRGKFYLVSKGKARHIWRLKRWFPEWFLGKVAAIYLDGERKKAAKATDKPGNR